MEDISAKKTVSFESDPLLQSVNSQRSDLDEDIFLTERSQDLLHSLEEEGSEASATSSQRWRDIKRILRSGSNFTSILKVIAYTDREKALRHVGVGEAAFLIQEAVLGEVENPAEGAYDPYIDPTPVFRNAMSVICRRICATRPVVQLLHGTAWILLALTFFEPPGWCRPGQYSHANHLEGCSAVLTSKGIPAGTIHDNTTLNESLESDNEVQYYPNTTSMFLTIYQSAIVETIGLAIIFILLVLRVCRDGGLIHIYLRPGKARWNRVTQIVSVLAMIFGLATGMMKLQPYFRLTLLLSFLTGVQRDMRVLIKMMFPEIIYLLGILGLFILFYAWFGCVMFVGTEEGYLYFPSLPEGMWSLYISVTTANYPDLMMPSYNENRWTALYFFSFMVITFFFVMNVILASVVNEYDNAVAERERKRRNAATDNLKKAFALLDSDKKGRIDRGTVMGLFYILNEDFPEFRTLSDDETKLLFAVLDKDGTSRISEEEFMDFGNVVLLEFQRADYYASFVEKYLPGVAASPSYQRFCKFVKSKYFEFTIDAILVLNAVVIAIQSAPELSGKRVEIDPHYYNGRIDTVWEFVEAIFTVIYALEVIAKIVVNGWRMYIGQTRNLFDFTITVLAVVSTAIVYYPNEFSDSRIIRMVVMARVLRLIRLLTTIPRFQMLAYIGSEILPAARTVVLLLFLMMYLFAYLGMSLYGGLITRDPQNQLSYPILSTEFADNEYWANNFNDMISGMNVLFNLLVVNNWTECEIGFEATTGSKWVRLFFIAFHVFGVIMVNNLVIAFIINEFLTHRAIYRETTSRETLENNEAVLYRRVAEFDGSTVTGTTTHLSGKYYARLAHSDSIEGRDHERLRKLFTRTTSSNDSDR